MCGGWGSHWDTELKRSYSDDQIAGATKTSSACSLNKPKVNIPPIGMPGALPYRFIIFLAGACIRHLQTLPPSSGLCSGDLPRNVRGS